MTYKNLLLHSDNGILTVTINRPDKLNALNGETMEEINAAFDSIYTDPSVAAVIVTGAGEKAFVAGADISGFPKQTPEQAMEFARMGQMVFQKIEDCPKPVIAAVNGFALGGGCELAMACHLRIASQNAKFGQPEVNLGIIPGYGGTQRLPLLIGKTKAMELIMTAELISADEALKLGLVNYVVPQDQLIPKCLELISKIRTKGPFAISAVIGAVNDHYKKGFDGFTSEVNRFGDCFRTGDCREGTTAFLEKRKPAFRGR
ncbi:MAG: enoyl-CoA hydratase/isomerase family protein [Bacteroidetes bacterium]|nr:enoyl-CoA hydratase/isomerase family protein [Bacteroidota bacterium]